MHPPISKGWGSKEILPYGDPNALALERGAGPGAGSRPIATVNSRTWQNAERAIPAVLLAKSRPCNDFRELLIGLRI